MTHSFRNRFLASLAGNATRIVSGIAGNLLIARGLPPARYGDLSFLLTSFNYIQGLLDLGSSNAFFTLLCQRPRSRRFYFFYCKFLFAQLVLIASLIILLPRRALNYIWSGHPIGQVVLAFCASFMQLQVWRTINQIGDAARKTVLVQSWNMLVLFAHPVILGIMFVFRWMSVSNILWALLLEYVAIVLVASPRLSRLAPLAEADEPELNSVRKLFAAYRRYCTPLLVFSVLTFSYEFGDRWMLQHFAGSKEQAYYSISAQIASISLLATVSVLRIFWKEIAEAHANADLEKAGALYDRVCRMMFMVNAVLFGLVFPWSEAMLKFALGEQYAPASAALALMLFYPIHQSIAQVGEAVLLGASSTKALATIRGFVTLFSLAAAYLMLAPRSAPVPGLGLGATGLAIKMVVVNTVSANIITYFIVRPRNWRFSWSYQFTGTAFLLFAGYTAKTVSLMCWTLSGPAFAPVFAFSALLYGLAVMTLIRIVPQLIGLHKDQAEVLLRYSPLHA